MKSRSRSTLNIPDVESEPKAVAVVTPEPTPGPARPMSERRRRRIAEEEARSLEIAEPPPLETAGAAAELSIPAGAPPTAGAAQEITPARAPVEAVELVPSGRYAYLLAGVASALWVGGVASWAAFEVGSAAAPLDALRIAIYALVALAPAGLAIMLAHAVRQGAGLAAETRRARGLAEALIAPTALAAQQSGEILNTLRSDIDHAVLASERARSDLALLRESLAQETARLNEAAENASRTAQRLTSQLGQEREAMTALGGQLDRQATGVIDAVERQSRMVVDASDLAQTQLREAEAALAARASDLAAAAGEAQDAARVAADDLARQTLRLENAGSGVAEQIQSVEEGLSQQRAALVTAAYALRTDQEDFSAQVESQRAQLTEQLSATRAAADDLGQTSKRTTDSITDLVEAASDQFRALVELSQREADGFDNATRVALDRFEALAAEARDGLVEETRRALAALHATADDARSAAAEAADHAQIRADRLGQSLFDAAQQADKAADARIEGARRIVNETAGMVDDAGGQVLDKLEIALERMNAAVARIDEAVTEVDERAARLPEEAQNRVDSVRAAVEDGLAALAAASRKAAEDTEALDAAFQERVRRNYDMLTEAVRLMGVVSGDSTPRRRDAHAAPDEGGGLRGRLRLEPVPAPASRAPATPVAPDRLDWNDLVQPDTPAAPAAAAPAAAEPELQIEILTERLLVAIRRMGVDPNALLPRTRVEEAAQALASGDPDNARQIVRRVAPAAVRSVSRRVLSDPELKTDAERYVRAVARELAAARGDGPAVLHRLSTDGGRAFMLLDAAVGDLG